MKAGSRGWILMAAGAAFLCSCTYTPRGRDAAPVVLPERYAFPAAGEAYPDRWWESFDDERLNALVSEALSGSFSLRQVKHRLEQARAAARKAGAARIPQVGIEATAARTHTDGTANQYGLNLAASYEIDLWGRIGATKRAAPTNRCSSRREIPRRTTG